MYSTTAFCFKYYLKRFCKTPMHIFSKFPDNFRSSILFNIELILWLIPGLKIITGNLAMLGKKLSSIQRKLLCNVHSCPAWSLKRKFFISYQRLNTQKHSVSRSLSCSAVFYEYFNRHSTYVALFIFSFLY